MTVIALIIVNYNGGDHLQRCLEAVHRQIRPPDPPARSLPAGRQR
jgi:Predicted glycosyltransferases